VCPQQEEFESFAAAPGSTVYVSEQVSFRTEGTQRVICVHGVVFAHYKVGDRAAETYAMITLCESGYASQTGIAQSFGYSARSMRRYQERFEAGGIAALARAAGRPVGAPIGNRKERGRDRTILHLKTTGMSNRAIAGRLGVSEMAIRKRLRRLGWKPMPQSCLPFERQTPADAAAAVEANESVKEISSRAPADTPTRPISAEEDGTNELPSTSLDPDPLDRSTDRALANHAIVDMHRASSDKSWGNSRASGNCFAR
jgi:transposase